MAIDSNKPLVSITTPSFNQGKFIEDTIKSVLEQDYPNIEYIVVDGGSTDNTLDILKRYEDRLIWISEPDEGQSDAINKGFKMAKGEIIAWLNSDDIYMPGAISTAVDFLVKRPDVVMVYGEGYTIDEHGENRGRFPATQKFNLWLLIHMWDYILQPTTFFRKEALFHVGLLNKDLHWCMDWDLWIRIGKRFKVVGIPKYLAYARVYDDNKTESGGRTRFREIVRVMRSYGELKYPIGYFIYGESALEKRLELRFSRIYKAILRKLLYPARAVIELTRVKIATDVLMQEREGGPRISWIKWIYSIIWALLKNAVGLSKQKLSGLFHFAKGLVWESLPTALRTQIKIFLKRESK
ncbi:MAG: glycosyltransferase [Actinobacteria bacterium]|nr:glycosyltransferase [Actinomycetota bacterium]